MIAKPDFGAEPFALGEARGVAIRGELDLDAAPGLTALVDEAVRTSKGTFVIDLSQHHVVTRGRGHLRDSMSHQARAEDADLLDLRTHGGAA